MKLRKPGFAGYNIHINIVAEVIINEKFCMNDAFAEISFGRRFCDWLVRCVNFSSDRTG